MSQTLPVESYQKDIEYLIKNHSAIILTAETGAGKSTMVPYWMWRKGYAVTVTQPRRIAARSLATYLAKKHAVQLGAAIGYQTGFERKMSRETRLLFVTDGVQMVREIKGNRHSDILILDEIHEWNLNQEVLIGLVKKKLDSGYYKKSRKKVIVMSATLQAKQLSHFLNDAPIIEIPGRGYPVTLHNHHRDCALADTVELVRSERNVLVFQPGKKEIADFKEMLEETLKADKLKAKILPLHSEISTKEQSDVFNHYPHPKVVIATDIAQTSITIDDIDSVIDTGLKKEVRTQKGIEGLFLTDISESECRQRAGRAGRVKSGQYILCAELDLRERPGFPEPEIRRLNLESVILRLIKWHISPLEFPFFHSPKQNLIHQAISRLKIFGALDENMQTTADGKLMAEMPVSLRSSRMMLEAISGGRQVMEDILKIIAIIEVKGIGGSDFSGEKIYEDPLRSDLLNHLALWKSPKLQKKLVNYKKLNLAKEIFRELKNRIKDNQTLTHVPKKSLDLSDSDILVRAIISAFPDFVYKKALDSSYLLGESENERHLDNRSILELDKPDMLVGIPFDLLLQWENRETGEIEKKKLPLISFASEISLTQLDRIKPFSYTRISKLHIQKDCLMLQYTVFFGGVVIAEFDTVPDFEKHAINTEVLPLVYQWLSDNMPRFKTLQQTIEHIDRRFNNLKQFLQEEGIKLKAFDFYWHAFLKRLIETELKTNDLHLFFNFNKRVNQATIRDILPRWVTHKLMSKKWPSSIHLDSQELQIHYNKGAPLLRIDYNHFDALTESDLILDSGAMLTVQLGSRKYKRWPELVKAYNYWKKADVFEKKWRNLKKEIKVIEDVKDIPFPQSFEGGHGKEKEKFIFYSVPEVVESQAYLIHFFEETEAQKYFEKNKNKWQQFLSSYQKSKIEDIFKGKGWKIKP